MGWEVGFPPHRQALARSAEPSKYAALRSLREWDPGPVPTFLTALLAEDVGPEEEWVSFPDGRTGILFRALCGDIWCGAISAHVDVSRPEFEDGVMETTPQGSKR